MRNDKEKPLLGLDVLLTSCYVTGEAICRVRDQNDCWHARLPRPENRVLPKNTFSPCCLKICFLLISFFNSVLISTTCTLCDKPVLCVAGTASKHPD